MWANAWDRKETSESMILIFDIVLNKPWSLSNSIKQCIRKSFHNGANFFSILGFVIYRVLGNYSPILQRWKRIFVIDAGIPGLPKSEMPNPKSMLKIQEFKYITKNHIFKNSSIQNLKNQKFKIHLNAFTLTQLWFVYTHKV